MARAKHSADTRARTLYVSQPLSHKPNLQCSDWLVGHAPYGSLGELILKMKYQPILAQKAGFCWNTGGQKVTPPYDLVVHIPK